MSVPPNKPESRIGLGVPTSDSGCRIPNATNRPRVSFTRRLDKIEIRPLQLKDQDRSPPHRNEIAKRFLILLSRLQLLEKYDLLYKYSPISPKEVRLLYLSPALRYEDDIFVEIAPTPDQNTDPIEDRQHYEALSYHWGPGPAYRPVYICGKRSNTKFAASDMFRLRLLVPDFKKGQRLYVRSNLDKALRSLRKKNETVVLWVDAICINQHDEKLEKPSQIAKMRHIYNKAENVCIWLGDGKDDSGEDRRKDFYAAMKHSLAILDFSRFESLLHEEYAKDWSNLLDLMQSSWFSRRWVIQELALAREATVHFGIVSVAWKDFADAIDTFVLNLDRINNLFRQSGDETFHGKFKYFNEPEPLRAKALVDTVTNAFRKNADGTIYKPVFNLETLAVNLASFESSDPRDSIFALLNIASESTLPVPEGTDIVAPPKVNYEKGPLEIYTDLLEWVVHSTGSLDMICRHWATAETKPGGRGDLAPLTTLPSWIQTVRKSTRITRERSPGGHIDGESLVGEVGRRRYDASHGKKPEVQFGERRKDPGLQVNPDPTASSPVKPQNVSPIAAFSPTMSITPPLSTNPFHMLRTKGMIIGTIKWASDPMSSGAINRESLEKGGWRFDEQPNHEVPYKLWRTMVADRDADGNNTPLWYHRAALHAMEFLDGNGHLVTQELLKKCDLTAWRPSQIVAKFLERVQEVTWNRKFIEGIPDSPKTDDTEPLFGLAPPETEVDDVICILFGCSVPCVLRNYTTKGNETYFRFIGETYVHGRMDGEGISMLSSEELRKRTVEFVIV
ncbi:heterokaryon incompatibility protein-domain-containing protein [Nemania abortiva]|nr:heterokaryon incompatibility protein-domain-containing protein [Nemania abortiva]